MVAAEFPLVLSAALLAVATLVLSLPRRLGWLRPLALLLIAAAALAPLALFPLLDSSRGAGRALWEWSAVGGPTIQAAYRVDGLAAIAVALCVAFAGAALAVSRRADRRHPGLPAVVLAIGLVSMAVVVTDDLIAATVPLAVLAAVSVLALLAIAPPAATARAAGFMAIGLQAWVVAALLISRQGSASFNLGAMPPSAIVPEAVLAATVGALLFSGLYPFVAWSFEGDGALDPGPLGRLVLMPAAIGASVLLLRLLSAARIEVTALPLPPLALEARLVLAATALLGVAIALVRGSWPRRAVGIGVALILLVALEPALHWSHLVLIAAILTALYAAAVSMALADQWESARSDLALVALWTAIATGSPLALTGAVVVLVARAGSALVGAAIREPHREYLVLVSGSTLAVAGALVLTAGAFGAADPVAAALGILAGALLVGLELAQVARRYRVAEVPTGLDVTSAIAAVLALTLAVVVVAVPLADAIRQHLARPARLDAALLFAAGAGGVLLVVLARIARPLLPYIERAAERSRPLMGALDPVPLAVGAFRALEAAASGAGAAFGAFERRAGVWLAALLFIALMLWATI